MLEKKIYITNIDKQRLTELLVVARKFAKKDEKYLRDLECELAKCEIVESNEIPSDVITMNSKIRLWNINTKKEVIYQLVFPYDADTDQGKISILAPIGTALLGYQISDIVQWKVPAGLIKFEVKDILYQPEAAGDYHL
ncbi:MAG: nucleoside diphosphate kinase regulator [Candidatus Cloacimonetes bacterium]|nr:nucleoside diphosphate kinase regulator [Candidatus Cloacimonadota bacterium]